VTASTTTGGGVASRTRTLTTALRATSVLAVLVVLWQGATAGGVLMHGRTSFELHETGAVVLHVVTGLAAVAAFLLWRAARTPLWPTVVAVLVFAASFLQAALGHDETMWAHVPGALLLMLGSAAVLVWSLTPVRGPAVRR
jgi:hypothetical protein